jgi:hypothetical protein
VRVQIWIPKRRRGLSAVDHLDARVRSDFIRAFLQSDIHAGDGIRYAPDRMIAADATLARYLEWVRARHAPHATRPSSPDGPAEPLPDDVDRPGR